MAGIKSFRQEKRLPSFYVMATAVVFVTLFLIGLWVVSSPSEPQDTQSIPLDVETKSGGKSGKESQGFEEGSRQEEKKEEMTKDTVIEEKVKELPDDTEQKVDDIETEQVEEKPSDMETKDEEEKEVPPTAEEEKEEEVVTDRNPQETDDSNKAEEDGASQQSEAEENGGAQSEIQIENKETNENWTTQASESKEEKEKVELKQQKNLDEETSYDEAPNVGKSGDGEEESPDDSGRDLVSVWVLCKFDGATDYIPCLDNKEAIKALPSTAHYEHRERHCPNPPPSCLVPLPANYRTPVHWPQSRNEVWYSNVPHPGLVSYKKDQNWVKKMGEKLIFPGGGTQFKHGAPHYIDFIEQTVPDISWGKQTRVILDVGCGVASFGGFLFDKDVLTMSFAPKDEHEAQIQLALERGIPAISSVMGTQRLVFPSNVYDAVHCARCRVPWHIEGGKLLLELNRVLRPGGFFLWSATPVYWKDEENVGIWKAMVALTSAICWDLVAKTQDSSTNVGIAIFRKPTTNFCYENRKKKSPPLCDKDDKPDAAWYIPMTACIHRIPTSDDTRGAEWPQEWPLRLSTAPTWLNNAKGLYGKPAAADFRSDTEHWQRVMDNSYKKGMGIDWKNIRNVMDMKAVYGGFAAALASETVWVMNVVQFDAADTLPIIFDRGLFGIYHDWCESFSSYPRTYDLLHSDHLFKKLKRRCNITNVMAEMDRLLRPNGWVIFRDKIDIIEEVQSMVSSLHWKIQMTYTKGDEGLLAVQKTKWRPKALS